MMVEAQTAAVLAIEAVKFARMLAEQIELSGMDELPEELRRQLVEERDKLNAQWAALAPRG